VVNNKESGQLKPTFKFLDLKYAPPGSRRDDLNIHRLTIIQSIMRVACYWRKYHVQASICTCVGTQREGISFTIERKQRRASDGGGVVHLRG